MSKLPPLLLLCFLTRFTTVVGQSTTADSVKRRTIDAQHQPLQPIIDTGTLTLKNRIRMLGAVTIKSNGPSVLHLLDKTVVNIGQNITTEGATVLEILRKLPGVAVTPDGQITMNGKPGVNVLIDGKTTYLSSEDLAGLLAGMQASGLDRIELMSNPSSKYDAAGTGGIINIIKKKNKKEGVNGSITASVAQAYYASYNGSLTLSYKNEHINLLVNNAYTYNKRFSSSQVNSTIFSANNTLLTEQVSTNYSNSTTRTDRTTAALDIYLSKRNTLTLSGTTGFGSAGTGLISSMAVRDSLLTRINQITYSSRLHDNPFNYTAGIQLSHNFDSAGRSITVNADHSEFRNFPLQTNYNALNDATGNFISETDNLLVQHRQLAIYAVKADYVQPLKNKGSFEAGIKSSYVKATNDNTAYDLTGRQQLLDLSQSDYSVNSENINAAYINLTKNWPNISAEAGLRAEQTVTKGKDLLTGTVVDLNYLQLFPALFLTDKINGQNSLTLRLGRRTDRPDYHELVPFRRPQTATLFFQGNPNLKPQVSWHGELGWNFLQALTLTLNYDIYTDYIRTLPFLDSNKTTLTRRPINIQVAHSWEIDLTYNKKLLSWWSTNNTAAIYSNAFGGEVAGYSLDNRGLVSLDFATNNSFRVSSALSAECDFEYESKRQFVNSTFGAYSVLDLGLKRSLFGGKGSLTLKGNNILQSQDRNAIDRNAGLYQVTNLHFYSRSVGLNIAYRLGSGKTAKIKIDSGSAEEQIRAGN